MSNACCHYFLSVDSTHKNFRRSAQSTTAISSPYRALNHIRLITVRKATHRSTIYIFTATVHNPLPPSHLQRNWIETSGTCLLQLMQQNQTPTTQHLPNPPGYSKNCHPLCQPHTLSLAKTLTVFLDVFVSKTVHLKQVASVEQYASL